MNEIERLRQIIDDDQVTIMDYATKLAKLREAVPEAEGFLKELRSPYLARERRLAAVDYLWSLMQGLKDSE